MANPKYHSVFKRKRNGKYNASPKQYKGSIYHSTKEADYAEYLDMMKKAANPAQRVVKWERQVKVELTAHGKHICNWFPDFRVWFADGHDEWHEVKSYITAKEPTFRIKQKLFLAQYPKAILLIVDGSFK